MDDLLKPLEDEHSALLAEQSELDAISAALADQANNLDALEQALDTLLTEVREAASTS